MIKLFFYRLIGFSIGTNLYIALVAAALALPGLVVFNPAYKWLNLAFVFTCTMLAYNLQRYFKWRTGHMPVFLYKYAFNQTGWMLLIIPLMAINLVLFFFMRPFHQWLLVGISGITGLYLFIHPSSGKLSGLRFIPFAKTLVVAFCWTTLFLIVCITPDILYFLEKTWLYWLLVFLQVWQSCLLFDIRDIEADRKQGVKTFANSLSTIQLFVFWLVLSIVILGILFMHSAGMNFVYAIPLLIIANGLQLVCLFRKTEGIWFTFMLDGSLVFYAGVNYLWLF